MTGSARALALCLALALGGAACGQSPAPTRVCAPVATPDPRGVAAPSGDAMLGSGRHYADEWPIRRVHVAAFFLDATEVTNDQFAAFVAATGYVTVAERPGPDGAPAGGAVFTPPSGPFDLADFAAWWRLTPGANWRRPDGPGSSIKGRGREPVVQVTLEDARAYAAWAGRRLPSEAEWEWAARGGLVGKDYVWGDDPAPPGPPRANSWQGVFPVRDEGRDGARGRSAVGCYPPNGYGLYDMAGNVWEITETPYDPADPGAYALKGGSYLCAPTYCGRIRPAARQPGDPSLPTNHIGFRTALSAAR